MQEIPRDVGGSEKSPYLLHSVLVRNWATRGSSTSPTWNDPRTCRCTAREGRPEAWLLRVPSDARTRTRTASCRSSRALRQKGNVYYIRHCGYSLCQKAGGTRRLTGTVPKLEADVASVKFVYRYRQADRLGPGRAVVMVNNQTLIRGTTLHSCRAEQTLLQGLAVRVQNQNRHLYKIYKIYTLLY